MRLPMWESDSVAWKLERVSPRCFFGHGWLSCEAGGTITSNFTGLARLWFRCHPHRI